MCVSLELREWTTVGQGCCLDTTGSTYSWYWAQGNLTVIKKKCELLKNCVGAEYGEWGTKGLVLIDGPAVDGQSFNHEDVGTGRISKSHAGNCHKHAICYSFGKHAFGFLAKD